MDNLSLDDKISKKKSGEFFQINHKPPKNPSGGISIKMDIKFRYNLFSLQYLFLFPRGRDLQMMGPNHGLVEQNLFDELLWYYSLKFHNSKLSLSNITL